MSSHDDAPHDDDEIDRRAILSRRAKLLSLALTGITVAAVAPSNNPVCAQHNVPAREQAPMRVRARPDAAATDATTDTVEAAAQDDSLPDLDQLPEETIDAGLTVSPRPQVCLSPPRVCLSNRIDEPAASGCGCRRNESTS